MEPVEIVSIVLVRRLEAQFAIAVRVGDLFDASGGPASLRSPSCMTGAWPRELKSLIDCGLWEEDGSTLMQGQAVWNA